jgi:hypothetical protein
MKHYCIGNPCRGNNFHTMAESKKQAWDKYLTSKECVDNNSHGVQFVKIRELN